MGKQVVAICTFTKTFLRVCVEVIFLLRFVRDYSSLCRCTCSFLMGCLNGYCKLIPREGLVEMQVQKLHESLAVKQDCLLKPEVSANSTQHSKLRITVMVILTLPCSVVMKMKGFNLIITSDDLPRLLPCFHHTWE